MISKEIYIMLLPLCLGAKLPPNFKRCDRQDPNFHQCFIDALQDYFLQSKSAFPSVGLPRLVPLSFTNMEIGAGHGPVSFTQHYTDCRLYAQGKGVVENATKIDFEKNELFMETTASRFIKLCRYHFDGQIMIFPINGEGESNITMVDLHSFIRFKLSQYEKKGQMYYRSDNCELRLEPKRIIFKFDNLFNGNKELEDNIHKVVNENWQEIFNDVKEGYERAFALIFNQVANGLFARVPISELFIN